MALSNSKKSFLLYNDQIDIINELTDEQAGTLMKMVYRYSGGESPDEIIDPTIKLTFIMLKSQIDRDKEKYDLQCKKNKENAIKRWEKRNATASDRMPPDAKYADTDNDNVTDTVTDNVTDTDFKDSQPEKRILVYKSGSDTESWG